MTDPQNDIPVFNLTDLQDWEPLLERLYNGLYMESFPDPDEREELDEWRWRLTSQPKPSDPLTATFVIGADLQEFALVERKVQGFLTVEFYRGSRCGLASYIAIQPTCRGRGWAKLLFREAKKWLKERCRKDTGENPRALFAEVHDPHKPGDPEYPDPLDPYQRVEVMGRLGAKWVGLPYSQPPLAEGRNWVEFLLMAFPVNESPLEILPVAVVRDFLREYYRALGIGTPEEDAHFRETFRNVEQQETLQLHEAAIFERTPLLSFREYSVAMHFIGTQTEGQWGPDLVFESFERDLLSFSHRAHRPVSPAHPPFSSRQVKICDKLNRLEIHFPDALRYRAEGENKKLFSNMRRHPVRLSASETVFHDKDKTAVLHLVFTPDARGGVDKAIMNEWDLVKLVKLWEGGEGVDDPGSEDFIQKHVKFDVGERPFTLGELVEKVFGKGVGPQPWCGTVQLLTRSETTPDWNRLYKLFRKCHEALDEKEVSLELIAVAGIIQGLLDFPFVDKMEVADVFQKEFKYEDSMVLGIHKGTLFEFTSECRVYDKLKKNLGANPYLLLPNALLCYNDYLLRKADQASKLSEKLDEKRLEDAILSMRGALQDRFLGNVFHYPTERFLYNYGMRSRGLLDFEKHLLRKLEELESKLRRSIEERERTYEKKVQAGQRRLARIALVFTVAGGISAFKAAKDLFPDALFAPIVGGVLLLLLIAYLKFEEDSR